MTDSPANPSLLALAMVALAAGPTADRLTRGHAPARAILDGALGGLMVGLIALHVLPEGYATAGLTAVLAAVVGFVAPRWVERATGVAGTWAAPVAVAGLMVHALLDGVALGTPPLGEEAERSALGLAVVVHRLPVGLLVWGMVRARRGPGPAATALVLLAGATVIGWGLGRSASWGSDSVGLALFQCLLGGTLLHLVREESPFSPGRESGCCGSRRRGWAGPRGETLGFLGGLALGSVLPGLHDHGLLFRGLGQRFVGLFLTSAPALLAGFALAGAVAAFLPAAPIGWVGRGRGLTQAAKGVVFGLPLPICSCGVVPVYKSLVDRGVPGAAALAFLIATPELGVESVVLTLPLFGWPFTVARVVAAALLALAVGLIVGRWVRRSAAPDSGSSPATGDAPRDRRTQLRRALRFGFVEVVDDVAAWILFGLALAAAIDPSTLGPWLGRLPSSLHVPLSAVAGIPLYVCASGATPIAAALVAAGLSPGAGLAFLLSGPSTNVTTFGLLSRLHGRTVAIAFAAVTFAGATALGWSVDAVLGGYVDARSGFDPDHYGPGSWAAAGILALVFLASLVRRGPRGWARDLS